MLLAWFRLNAIIFDFVNDLLPLLFMSTYRV